MKKILLMILTAILFVGCSNNGEEENANDSNTNNQEMNTEKTEEQEKGNNENVDEDAQNETSNDNADNEEDVYGGAQKTANYFIDSKMFDKEKTRYTAFSINRDDDETQDLSPEARLKESLLNNDPSEQDILETYTDLSLENSNLEIHFNQAGNELSTTTAQSGMFFNSLFGISDMYGVEDITFLNPNGKKDIIVAERNIDAPIIIEDERDLTRGYYTIYDEESEKTFFLAGADLEEKIVNDNGDPLSFAETVEAMGTTNDEASFYDSALVEGIDIVDASFENGVANVQYTMEENKITADDRTVFEKAIQLTALDFNAWEVELMNDTLKESNTYPLIGQ